MCDVVRLKRGSAAFHFALDMVGTLDGADQPVLPERPMPGARTARTGRMQALECKIYHLNPARASGSR